MAAKLQDEEHGSGAAQLNSCGEDKGAIEESANGPLPGIVSGAVETMFVEAMFVDTMFVDTELGNTMLGESMPGTAFVEPACWGGPETILLVEDEGFVRGVTAEVLESAGYQLLIARSGAEALDSYRQFSKPVDLLLADIVMPGMSGHDLAAEFESLCPYARVLLMSGDAGQLAEVFPSGKTCLAKPFSARILLKQVREILDTNPADLGARA
jgi:CheY-like chemotaxis protein